MHEMERLSETFGTVDLSDLTPVTPAEIRAELLLRGYVEEPRAAIILLRLEKVMDKIYNEFVPKLLQVKDELGQLGAPAPFIQTLLRPITEIVEVNVPGSRRLKSQVDGAVMSFSREEVTTNYSVAIVLRLLSSGGKEQTGNAEIRLEMLSGKLSRQGTSGGISLALKSATERFESSGLLTVIELMARTVNLSIDRLGQATKRLNEELEKIEKSFRGS